jgi:Beta-ketoacyl synthase, C-terminal domain
LKLVYPGTKKHYQYDIFLLMVMLIGNQALVRKALESGGLASTDIGYVCIHGTGTPLGDPIEVGALSTALRPQKDTGNAGRAVGLGSVKVVPLYSYACLHQSGRGPVEVMNQWYRIWDLISAHNCHRVSTISWRDVVWLIEDIFTNVCLPGFLLLYGLMLLVVDEHKSLFVRVPNSAKALQHCGGDGKKNKRTNKQTNKQKRQNKTKQNMEVYAWKEASVDLLRLLSFLPNKIILSKT